MFAVWFHASIYDHMGYGPMWNLEGGFGQFSTDACRKNWWTNLLFINNFFGLENPVGIFFMQGDLINTWGLYRRVVFCPSVPPEVFYSEW